jgi:hypothetical protein
MFRYFPCSQTNSAIFFAHSKKPHLRSTQSNDTLRVCISFFRTRKNRGEGGEQRRAEESRADSELNYTYVDVENDQQNAMNYISFYVM